MPKPYRGTDTGVQPFPGPRCHPFPRKFHNTPKTPPMGGPTPDTPYILGVYQPRLSTAPPSISRNTWTPHPALTKVR